MFSCFGWGRDLAVFYSLYIRHRVVAELTLAHVGTIQTDHPIYDDIEHTQLRYVIPNHVYYSYAMYRFEPSSSDLFITFI